MSQAVGRSIGRHASSPALGLAGRRVAAAALVLFAAGAGWAWGRAHGSAGTEAELVRLLRFMALLKLATAAAAAWLVDWRLRAASPMRLALGYPASVALMALAPGLIWHPGSVLAGALAFHAGLVALLVLAYGDRDGARAAVASRLGRRPR